MKKTLTFVFVLAVVLLSCKQPDDPTHVHQWGEWTVTTASNCTVTGSKERVCLLDVSHKETESIPIIDNAHNWQLAPTATAPTCTADGNGEQICAYNSNHTKTSTIAALGHDYQNWTITTALTCTTTGIETGTCTHDNTHKDTRAIPALGHDWQWLVTTAPTCEITGIETEICTHDSTHIKDTRSIAALGHDHFESLICKRTDCNHQYSLGDTGPGGGKIFYISETGFIMTDDNSTAHYLEATPSNIGTDLVWISSEFTSIYMDTTSVAIGTGRKNTALILAVDANAPAAKVCNDYSNNGLSDWFLPSKDELNQLYINRTSVGNLENYGFWSSSQSSTGLYVAWGHLFINRLV